MVILQFIGVVIVAEPNKFVPGLRLFSLTVAVPLNGCLVGTRVDTTQKVFFSVHCSGRLTSDGWQRPGLLVLVTDFVVVVYVSGSQ